MQEVFGFCLSTLSLELRQGANELKTPSEKLFKHINLKSTPGQMRCKTHIHRKPLSSTG